MTDKQIIIDGKIKPITLEDVPTILELHKSKSFIEIAKMYGVTQNAIRYWVKKYNVKPLKQKDQIKILEEVLKAKEQECEELKKNVEHWKMEHKEAKAKGEWTYDLIKKRLGQQLDQLKTEKEEIKKYLGISSKTIMERLEELQEFRDNDKYKLYQAEQTLTEIKEIAEQISLPMGTGKSSNRVILAKQILQKISEVVE